MTPSLFCLLKFFTREKTQKIGINQSEDQSAVTLRNLKTYEFIREESVGSEDDLVTIVNIPLLVSLVKNYEIKITRIY